MRGTVELTSCSFSSFVASAPYTSSHPHIPPLTHTSPPIPRPPCTSCSSRHIRIYTKTGDSGTSSLYNGERRPKDDEFFEALGDVDELNSAIGLAREYALGSAGGKSNTTNVGLDEALSEIQSRLLDVGSAIATPKDTSKAEQVAKMTFPPDPTAQLEKWIDDIDSRLPPLKNFILPVR
jgi:cob(I)alamin adenosyltransferase